MRLHPFVPHDPIEDVEHDANRHYSNPDAVDDQTIFNDSMLETEQSPLTENTSEIDTNEPEIVYTEHGTIYYEHERVYDVPLLPSSYRRPFTVDTHTNMILKPSPN